MAWVELGVGVGVAVDIRCAGETSVGVGPDKGVGKAPPHAVSKVATAHKTSVATIDLSILNYLCGISRSMFMTSFSIVILLFFRGIRHTSLVTTASKFGRSTICNPSACFVHFVK